MPSIDRWVGTAAGTPSGMPAPSASSVDSGRLWSKVAGAFESNLATVAEEAIRSYGQRGVSRYARPVAQQPPARIPQNGFSAPREPESAPVARGAGGPIPLAWIAAIVIVVLLAFVGRTR